MKRHTIIIIGVVIASLLVIIWPGSFLLAHLGLEPICITGTWPDLKITSCSTRNTTSDITRMPLPTLPDSAVKPIIVDDDGSPDGVIALLYFLSDPSFDVRAVTISNGEAHPDLFAGKMTEFLTSLGKSEIPVGEGRTTPLQGDNAFPDPWRESSDGFWDMDLQETIGTINIKPAAELIVDTIMHAEQPVTVFVSGPQTNLAEALRLNPDIADNIRDVFIMGGSINEPGNIESDWPDIHNRVSEWNIWVDPLAASEVLHSGLPLHIIPLDATDQVIFTEADVIAWEKSDSAEGQSAGDLLGWMLESWAPDGMQVWDLVAAVAAAAPDACPETQLSIDVLVPPGSEQGRTIITDDTPNTGVCLDPDIVKVKGYAAFILDQ